MDTDTVRGGSSLSATPKLKKNIFIEEVENGFVITNQNYPYTKQIAKDAYETANVVSDLLMVK